MKNSTLKFIPLDRLFGLFDFLVIIRSLSGIVAQGFQLGIQKFVNFGKPSSCERALGLANHGAIAHESMKL